MRRTRRRKRRSRRRKNNKCSDFVPLYENIESHSYFEKIWKFLEAMNLEDSKQGCRRGFRGRNGKGEMMQLYYNLKN